MKRVVKKKKPELLGEADMHLLKQGVSQLGYPLAPEQQEKLFQFAQLIQKWNEVYNLTAIRNGQAIITHHILDSLAALVVLEKMLPQAHRNVLDVGAGAGLPGLVWAIAKPVWQITLVDTVQKKVAFIQQAIAHLGLNNVQAKHARVENLHLPAFDLICSRAFSSLELFIHLSQHVLAPQGVFAALKGKLDVDRSVPLGWFLQGVHPIEVPFLEEERHLFLIQKQD